ncbi:hypothetical protein BH20ACT16_BH20ACT16_02850 [soil metagenome]
MRPRDTLTPEQQQELEAIDRALAGEPVELELRELEELVLDIRTTAPEMTPAFAARLEHEVSEGFPAPREQPAALTRRPGRRWLLLPALGSLAAVLVALIVVFGSSDDPGIPVFSGGSEALPARGAAADEAASPADSATSSSGARESDDDNRRAARPSPAVTPPPPPDSAARNMATLGDTARKVERKVERNASIAIETPRGGFDRATDAVNAVVARFRGIVASSQIGASDASGGEATFDLRIPTDRLDAALAALSKLGHVTERTQGLQDITSSFTSARDRLTDARAERRGLLRALERATTQAQIDSLKAQLRSVGGRINGLKGQLASLERRADLATVSLTVRATGERTETGTGGNWTPGDAAGDALRVLEVLAGVMLIALAILLPAGLLGAAVALGVRFGRRRRREAALDPA